MQRCGSWVCPTVTCGIGGGGADSSAAVKTRESKNQKTTLVDPRGKPEEQEVPNGGRVGNRENAASSGSGGGGQSTG